MENGGLLMTKPDFSKMTRRELRVYALAHRDDGEVITELLTRANPDRPVYPYPETDADLVQMEEIFRRKIAGDDSV
jgi:hypothetical protein